MSYSAISAMPFSHKTLHHASLYVAFAVGFFLGSATALHISADYGSLIHEAILAPVPVFSVIIFVLPWILTAMLYWSNATFLFPAFSFFQAFGYGIILTSVYVVYGSAYWLIGPLLLFTRTVTLILSLWFWVRHISDQRLSVRTDLILCASISLFAAALDYYLISPLLFKLSIY